MIVDGKTQTTSVFIHGTEYRQEDGKWYNYVQNRRGDEIIPERLVVRMSDRGSLESFDFGELGIKGVSLASQRYLNGFYVLHIAESENPFNIARILETTGLFDQLHFDGFDGIGRNPATPDDPKFSEQWNLAMIEMEKAWDITTGSSDIILAFVDRGFEWQHEDLAENLWQNLGEDANQNGKTLIFSNGEWIFDPDDDLDDQDNDGNGKLNDLIGWDFVNDDNDPVEGGDHGTITSGVAVAKTFNGVGIAGVAGGWQNRKGASLMVLGDGINNAPISSAVAQAIEYAVDKGAKVINMSTELDEDYTDVKEAVQTAAQAGVIMVAAAGNNGGNSSKNKNIKFYPALYPETITVGATDQNDERWADNSTRGSAIGEGILDLMAPGVLIWTTVNNNAYDPSNGTSEAAPHVAGLAALILSLNSSLSDATVESILKQTADWQSWFNTEEYGSGRINAYEALKYTLENYGGTLSGEVLLTEDLTISSGAVLTVEEGTTIKFDPGIKLTINGTLNVNGQSGSE
ncbi:MAG: S8 family serine peptidase, partial [Gammaproteobacteria bacterium]|nr:S8 family serine peptidase [Gammaproteobacteria bacterium]